MITLANLRVLAAFCIVAEFGLAFAAGAPAMTGLVVAIAFSILMLKEFFAAEWLRRHFLVYATSHMLLMPLLSLMIFSFATGQMPWQAPPVYWLYAFVGFFVTFNVEVSRKIRAPEDEIDGLDSYSKIFGTYGAARIVLALRLIDTTLVSVVGHFIGVSAWFYVAVGVLFLGTLGTFIRFRLETNTKSAKALERNAGIYLIAFDLILAIELIRLHGFRA